MRLILLLVLLLAGLPLHAQTPGAEPLASVLETYHDQIAKPSRQTIGPVIEALASAGPAAGPVLAAWADKQLGLVGDRLVLIGKDGLTDAATGETVTGDVKPLKPNSGVRALIAAALVQVQLSDPDPARRSAALEAIARQAEASDLDVLREAAVVRTTPQKIFVKFSPSAP